MDKTYFAITPAFKIPNKQPIEILLDDKWKEEVYIYEIS